MLAVFVNCASVILGSLLGLLFKKKFTPKLEEVIQTGAGIITLVLGFQMAFKFQNIIYFTLAIILGGITGTLVDLDNKILLLGKKIESLVYRKNHKPNPVENEATPNDTSLNTELNTELKNETCAKTNFSYAFLNSSVLFCVGAMSILGSLKAGIEKDYTIIFTKSILDGFMAISFSAAMGIGTAFSALTILIYQGALTLLSTVIKPFCTEQMLAELTGCGGALIIMIGINLIGVKKIKTANYLFALIFTVIFVLLNPYLSKIIPF